MTLNEFIESLQKYQDLGYGDCTVSVSVMGGLSCNAVNPIKSIHPGFDWTAKHFMLIPETPVERYLTQKQRDEIKERREKYVKEHEKGNS